MTPAAVLFDCDGVLVDSEPITLALLREEFLARGLDMPPGEMQARFVGGTIKSVAETARDLGVNLPDDWVGRFYDRLFARLAEGTPLIPGIEFVLDRLDAAGIPFAVGSNGTVEKMTITLSQHPGVWHRVRDRLYSGQDLGCPKPDPGLYLHAARALGAAPGFCVVIDDTAPGCQAGVTAGMRTLGFAAHDDGAALVETGAEVFRTMADLPDLLGL